VAPADRRRGVDDRVARRPRPLGREIEIAEHGPGLVRAPVAGDGRCATTFSGGKDSLVQTGLLAELTTRPVLVTITSPIPGTDHHVTARRRHVLREIAMRRDAIHVEVLSEGAVPTVAWSNPAGIGTSSLWRNLPNLVLPSLHPPLQWARQEA
jgi:hypothetical protein